MDPNAALPRIDSITPPNTTVGAQNLPITLTGVNFGSSPTVNLPQGFTSTGQLSSDTRIVINVTIGTNVQRGVNAISATTGAGTSSAVGLTVTPNVAILKLTGTVISNHDGNDPEDSTIQVTAVDADASTPTPITTFTGSVNLVEDDTAIYSQNGGCLVFSQNTCSSSASLTDLNRRHGNVSGEIFCRAQK